MRNPGSVSPDHRGIAATVSRARPSRIADARPGEVVKVNGTAAPGPAGPLVAPLSGQPCVWFRTLTFSSGRLGNNPGARPTIAPVVRSDMGLAVTNIGTPSQSTESPAPFAVADETGTLLIDPAHADVDTGVVTVDRQSESLGGWTAEREWIIPAGAPVFACGAAVASGSSAVLEPREDVFLVASTFGEAFVLQRSEGFVGAGPAVARSTGSAIGIGLLAGVGGIVLLVLIVVIAVVV